MAKKRTKFEPRYSGPLSETFWRRVNRIPWCGDGQTVYALGCALQDLEGRVITALNNAENRLREKGGK